MTPFAMRLAADANGVASCTARSRARCGRRSGRSGVDDPDRPRHQRRPPRARGSRPSCAALLRRDRRRARRRRPSEAGLGARRDRLAAAELWRVHRCRERALGRRAATRTRRSIRTRSRSASRAASPPTSGRPAPLRSRRLERLLGDPIARCSSSSPARRTRRTTPRQGADPADRPARARPRAPRPDRLPRGLRHGHRARDRPGRRRLAEHAAPRRSRRAARAA